MYSEPLLRLPRVIHGTQPWKTSLRHPMLTWSVRFTYMYVVYVLIQFGLGAFSWCHKYYKHTCLQDVSYSRAFPSLSQCLLVSVARNNIFSLLPWEIAETAQGEKIIFCYTVGMVTAETCSRDSVTRKSTWVHTCNVWKVSNLLHTFEIFITNDLSSHVSGKKFRVTDGQMYITFVCRSCLYNWFQKWHVLCLMVKTVDIGVGQELLDPWVLIKFGKVRTDRRTGIRA